MATDYGGWDMMEESHGGAFKAWGTGPGSHLIRPKAVLGDLGHLLPGVRIAVGPEMRPKVHVDLHPSLWPCRSRAPPTLGHSLPWKVSLSRPTCLGAVGSQAARSGPDFASAAGDKRVTANTLSGGGGWWPGRPRAQGSRTVLVTAPLNHPRLGRAAPS